MNIKPICELKGFQFKIPRYQRGYRWDAQQIEMLLNDLNNFSLQNQSNRGSSQPFYCLQPVVVINQGMENNHPIFEVVDGQQRLTTLFLLIDFLNFYNDSIQNRNLTHDPYFSLELEGRQVQDQYIKDFSFADNEDNSYLKNIDNFYLHKAYQTIKKWFQENYPSSQKDKIAGSAITEFQNLLCDSLAFTKFKKPYVAIIWYEIDKDKALTSFSNLNYGKIPLSSTDIVKALLLQKDCYGEDQAKIGFAIQRANEWENISVMLSNPELKGMIGDRDINLMDIIVRMVATDINEGVEESINIGKGYGYERKKNLYTEDLFDYVVINKYLNEAKDRSVAAEKVWKEITKYANKISNWYDNRSWYHLIGLYSIIANESNEQLIRKIVQQEKGKNQKDFLQDLKKEIGKKIKVDDKDQPADKKGLNHPELRYGGRLEGKIRNILKAFNVYLEEFETDGVRRFQFEKFRAQNPTSLEHIHPKSIEDYNLQSVKVWLNARQSMMTSEEIQEFNSYLISDNSLKTNITRVKQLIEAIEPRFNKLLIDTIGDESKIIRQNEVHHIKNMALLDKDTNAALQFNPLDTKRNLLIEKVKEGIFIPPATLLVFSKHFTAGSPDSMRFWLHEDREAYLNKLETVYKFFTD